MYVLFASALAVFAQEPEAVSSQTDPKTLDQSTPAAPDPLPLYLAISEGDTTAANEALKSGIDPNAVLPHPAPQELFKRFVGTSLEFYVRSEPGLTPIMLASGRGDVDMVQLLLAWGADRHKETTRNKTFPLWLAAKHGHIEVMKLLMNIKPDSEAARTRIQISLKDQKATLFVDDVEKKTMPVSSGRKKFPTPPGRYLITNKYKMWTSNIYEVKMPFFMRLSCGDVGLHAGSLPGYPASHGCVRLPAKAAQELFATVPIGTLVEIQ